MLDIEKLKKIVLTGEEQEFLKKHERGEVKLEFWNRKQLEKLKSINEKLVVDKKKIEGMIDSCDCEIELHEHEIRQLESQKSEYNEILDSIE